MQLLFKKFKSVLTATQEWQATPEVSLAGSCYLCRERATKYQASHPCRQMKYCLLSRQAVVQSAQINEITLSCSGQSAFDDSMTDYRLKRLSGELLSITLHLTYFNVLYRHLAAGDTAASVLDYDSDDPARFERSVREEYIYQLQLDASGHPQGSRVLDHEPEADFVQMPVRRQPFQPPQSVAHLDPAPPLVAQNTYQLQQPPGQCKQTAARQQKRSSPSVSLQFLGNAEHNCCESQRAEQHPRIKGLIGGYNSQLQHSQPGPSINGFAKRSQAGLAAAGSSASRRLFSLNSSPQAELAITPNNHRDCQHTQLSNSFDSLDDYLDCLLPTQAAAGTNSASKEPQGEQGQDWLLGSLLGTDQPTSMSASQQTDEQTLPAGLMDPSDAGFLLLEGGLPQDADAQAKACSEQLDGTAVDSLLGGLLLADSSSAESQTSKQPETRGPGPAAPQRLPKCVSDPVWSESADLTDMLSLLGVSARQPQQGEALEGQCSGVDAQPAVEAKRKVHSSTAISTGQETPASKSADPAEDRLSTDKDPFLAEILLSLSNGRSLAAEQDPPDLYNLLFGDELAAVTPDKQAVGHSATGSGSTTPPAVQQSWAGNAAGCDGSSQSSGSGPCSFSEWLQMPSPMSSASEPAGPAVAPTKPAVAPTEPAVAPECGASAPAEPTVAPTAGTQCLSCTLCKYTAPSISDLVAHITSEAHLALKRLMSARRKRTPQISSPGELPVLSTCSEISQVWLHGKYCQGCC